METGERPFVDRRKSMENVRSLLIGVGALAALFLWLGPALGQEKAPVRDRKSVV